MRRLLTAAALLTLLAAGASPPAWAGEPAQSGGPAQAGGPDLSLPRDDRENWRLGFSSLERRDLSPENSYLADAVPLLVRDGLARFSWHDLTGQERAARRQGLIAKELAALAQSIGRLRKERDDAFFEMRRTGLAPVSPAGAGLPALEERREFLESLDPLLIEVAARKRIAVVDGPGGGKLFDPPSVSRERFCRDQDLDMLVGGSVREVQGFLRLDLWAWDASQGKTVFSWREAGTREELYATLTEAGDGFAGPVLGGLWASLTVSVTPTLAMLEVDGLPATPTGAGELILAPGTHEVRVSAPGHSEKVRTVQLAAGEAAQMSLELERLETGILAIVSDPPGADLYVNSLWMGKTPLSTERPVERSRILLAKDGFLALPFSVGPATPVRDLFILEPKSSSRDAQQKAAREAFYSAFGWLLVSIPAPLFCYRYAFDYADKAQSLYDSGMIAEGDRAVAAGNALYWTSVGGAVLSASLFAWVVSTIIRYIAVSDRAAG